MRSILSISLLLFSGAALAAGSSGGEDGGMPVKLIAFHAFNLLLLLSILYFFFGAKIKTAIASRASTLKETIEASERAEQAARARFEEIEQQLSGFEKKLEAMRADADVEAGRERELILARADRQVEQIEAAARRSIREETARARQQLRSDAAALAVEMATQQVTSSITSGDRERLTHDFLNQLDTGVGHG